MNFRTLQNRCHTRGGKYVLLSALAIVASQSGIITPVTLAQAEAIEWEHSGLGDANGSRSRLADSGFTYLFTEDLIASHNSGGIETGDAIANRLVGFGNWELGKYSSLENSSIRASFAWYIGDDINEKTGTFFKPNTNYLEPQVRLYELYWSQNFNDKQINLHAGRVGFGPEEFGYSQFLYEFQSAGFSSNPGGFFANQPTTTFSEAVATWGARMLFSPAGKDYSIRLGIYDGWPRDQGRTSAHGLDWSFGFDKASLLVGEYAYKFNQDSADTGLPGNYKVGIMYDTGPFSLYDDPNSSKDGNAGYYFIFDQMVFSESNKKSADSNHASNWRVGKYRNHPSDEGLYVWGSVVANPDDTINLFPYWLTGGLHYKGPFKSRHADRIGIGYRYGFMTDNLALEDESATEAYYHFQVNPASSLSLNLQYIKNPGGGGNPNAFVTSVGFSIRY